MNRKSSEEPAGRGGLGTSISKLQNLTDFMQHSFAKFGQNPTSFATRHYCDASTAQAIINTQKQAIEEA